MLSMNGSIKEVKKKEALRNKYVNEAYSKNIDDVDVFDDYHKQIIARIAGQ